MSISQLGDYHQGEYAHHCFCLHHVLIEAVILPSPITVSNEMFHDRKIFPFFFRVTSAHKLTITINRKDSLPDSEDTDDG